MNNLSTKKENTMFDKIYDRLHTYGTDLSEEEKRIFESNCSGIAEINHFKIEDFVGTISETIHSGYLPQHSGCMPQDAIDLSILALKCIALAEKEN